MQSKISFCNRAVLRKNLTRFTPLWIAYLALWLIVLPLSLYNSVLTAGSGAVDTQYLILKTANIGGCLIGMVYAILTVMALFAFLYGARSVNTIAALPVRRETLFFTNLCTGILVALVPNLIIALLTWLITTIAGYAMLGTILQWLAIVMMQYLFFFGLACICACFVGHLLALPILYGLLSFSAVVLNFMVLIILSTFVYGMPTNRIYNQLFLSPLSPPFELLSNFSVPPITVEQGGLHVTTSYFYNGWRYLAALAVAGAVLLLVSFLLFRRRHMETAGDIIAIRPLRPVFKYCFTVGCSVVLGVLAAEIIYNGNVHANIFGIIACLLGGGFVGYFGSEILLKKTLHVFGRAWIGFCIFSLCLIGATAAMEFDVFGYEKNVPELSQVQAVSISPSNQSGGLVTDEAHMVDVLTLHQRVIDEKRQQERYAKDAYYWDYLEFVYTLKNGEVFSRTYKISASQYDWRDETSLIRQYEAVYNDPYLVELRYMPNDNLTAKNISSCTVSGTLSAGAWQNVELTYDEAYALYTTCILPDIRDGNLGRASFAGNHDVKDYATTYATTITLQFDRMEKKPDGTEARYSSYLDISIPITATRTVAFLVDHDITPLTQTQIDTNMYQ